MQPKRFCRCCTAQENRSLSSWTRLEHCCSDTRVRGSLRQSSYNTVAPQDEGDNHSFSQLSALRTSVPSKALCTKTPGTHLPENPIFLSSSSDADTEQVTARNKGDVEGQKKSSPRSIIFSCILQERQTSNKRLLDTRGTYHIFLYSSGQLPRHSLTSRYTSPVCRGKRRNT